MRIEIPTWILCGSHGKFELTPSAVFEYKPDSNSDSIFCEYQFLPLLGPHVSLFSQFSLSSRCCAAPHSLGHYNFFENTTYGHHGRLFKLTNGKTQFKLTNHPKANTTKLKKNLIHISIMIQKTQQNPAQHHQTFLLALGSGIATLLSLGYCPSEKEKKRGKEKKK